ncbi:VOC family protein [Caenimonas aquaedulcis]|uniref:VOC family protein n=1 Tax=Caenimonas aquaedulcis TaxID=2793270 RepID=A0A931MGC1_9BURK|nr:VOC family protein [Caenimonas aquaedulcis]MBG9388081.1 VOC family protein [Caenimonas aquaedulcis]
MDLNIYLTFDGRCEEALKFYAQALGGTIGEFHRFGGSPMDDGKMPAEFKNRVMHGRVEANGQILMGSDAGPGQPFQGYKGFTVSVNVPDTAQGMRTFDALAAGGQVTMPFQKTFWAEGFGMLNDKFGVPWMVNCEAQQG